MTQPPDHYLDVVAAPTTGHEAIDAALAHVDREATLGEQHDAIAAALETIQNVLNPPQPHS